jgi:selenophosphate synthetase-related protein
MSFVIDPKDYDKIMVMFEAENLEAYQIAEITDDEDLEEDRLKMKYK